MSVERAKGGRRLELDGSGKAPGGSEPDPLLTAFDAMTIGEALLLRSTGDLRPHFERLRSLRAGDFSWSPQEPEDGKDQALITRLGPKDGEASVGGYFGRDHDEIDVLLEYARRDLRAARQSGGAPPATLLPYFEEFQRRLERHIRWEEELLFPAVESGAPGLAAGPGRVMRLEHQEIRRIHARLSELLREPASAGRLSGSPEELLKELLSVLAAHNMKEEAVYYPLADRRLSREESGRLLSQVRLTP